MSKERDLTIALITEKLEKLTKKKVVFKENEGLMGITREAYDRMEELSGQSDLNKFLNGADNIMADLTADGFESADVYKFLYLKLINNV